MRGVKYHELKPLVRKVQTAEITHHVGLYFVILTPLRMTFFADPIIVIEDIWVIFLKMKVTAAATRIQDRFYSIFHFTPTPSFQSRPDFSITIVPSPLHRLQGHVVRPLDSHVS